jgi:hypothetical protein
MLENTLFLCWGTTSTKHGRREMQGSEKRSTNSGKIRAGGEDGREGEGEIDHA